MHDAPDGGLDALERLTRAQWEALSAIPEDQALPPDVLALLAAPAPVVPAGLTPSDEARLAGIHAAVGAMIARLSRRRTAVAHRLRSTRRARTGPPPPRRWDRLG